jgi:beta-lactamase regulating signal transducer with metallopeptidase domain
MQPELDEESFFRKAKILILIAMIFLLTGIVLQSTAFNLEFNEFTPILEELKPLQKSVVDTADPASRVAMLKTEAAKFPPKLLTFKLVGVGAILTGIWIVLFVILQALKTMPLRLAKVIAESKESEKK